MLNNEAGKVNKPIRMDSNIFLVAGIRVGANVPQSETVRRKRRQYGISGPLRIVQNVKINHPRSTRLINAEKME